LFSKSVSLKGIFASLFRKMTGYFVSHLHISCINFLPLQPKPGDHPFATLPDWRRMADVAKLCCCVISPFSFSVIDIVRIILNILSSNTAGSAINWLSVTSIGCSAIDE
jgi:hypothetical protein